jgi:hypothetical protein
LMPRAFNRFQIEDIDLRSAVIQPFGDEATQGTVRPGTRAGQ